MLSSLRFSRLLSAITLVATLLTLSACGIVKNRSNDYLNAQNMSDIEMPKGVTKTGFEDSYTLPKTKSKDVSPISLVPPGLEEEEKTLATVEASNKKQDSESKETTTTEQQTTNDKEKHTSPLLAGPQMASTDDSVQLIPIGLSGSSANTSSQENTDEAGNTEQETTSSEPEKKKYNSPLVGGPAFTGF